MPRVGAVLRWWTRHPWGVFWAAPLILLLLIWLLADYGGRFLARAILAAFLFVWLASLIQGLRLSLRRSKLRPMLIAVLLLVLLVGATAMYRRIFWQATGPPAKAQADVRAIASAVTMYSAHVGRLPQSLTDLTVPSTNAKGETSGPFMGYVPTAPSGWTPYTYAFSADGTFTISATGDGMIVRAP